ncbi:MAG: hypothetical protein IKX39_01825 [Muribaculaceae bacterium]|nr:hypothetical protein [Muribaculaceae bacterium]
MKKFTLMMMACLVALISQAQVTPPAGSTSLLYTFSGLDTYINQNKTFEVFVVFEGQDVYIQGLSEYLTSGWVKGTLDGEGVLDVPAAYMGDFEFWGDTYSLDFDGAEFIYDEVANTFTAAEGYTTSVEGMVLDEFANVVLTGATATPATPATPAITEFTEDDYGYYVKMNIPATDVDGNDLFTSFLFYQLYYQKADRAVYEYEVTTDNYEFAEENMKQIPYNYTDYYDIDVAGAQVYLYGDDIEDWTAVGVKSIYTVNGESNESPISWYPLVVTGINGIQAESSDTHYYDLQGRQVDANAAGILIQVTRLSNGTVRTVKVVR